MTALAERGPDAAPQPRWRLPGWARSALVVAIGIAILAITVTLTGQVQLTSSGTAQAAVRLLLPILLAGLGGLWSERAGVVNIGLEGMMILGTWGAAWAGYQWGPWAAHAGRDRLRRAGRAAARGRHGDLRGEPHRVRRRDHPARPGRHEVPGVAGVPADHRNPRESPRVEGFTEFSIPGLSQGAAALEAQQRVVVSDVAGLLGGLVTNLTPLVVIGFALVPLSYYLLWHTRFGLRLRSCGENPVAAESLGVNVYRYKYFGVVISGGLAGLGGAALVLNPGQLGYLEGQTGGRGYIGLAAMIFGNWAPVGLLAGSALFGYVDGLQLRAGGEAVHALLYAATLIAVVVAVYWAARRSWVSAAVALGAGAVVYAIYWSIDTVPREFATYAPQLVTLIVLAVAAQHLRPPATAGEEYRRGEGD